MKTFAAAVYLAVWECLAHIIRMIDFSGLTRSQHLLKAVKYVAWHNK